MFRISLIGYFSSFVSGGVGAWFMARNGHLIGLIDRPNHRSSHDRPIPKGGGIGILIAFAGGCVLKKISIWFWMPVCFLSLLCLFGDRIHIKPALRLVMQFCVAFLFLSTLSPTLLKFTKDYQQSLIDLPLNAFFALYIVGTANFYNFMDGINGIAGVTGVIGFVLLGAFGMATGQNLQWVTLAFVLGFACLGFLPFNMPAAKVFMGDVGSVLLGFVFACLVVAFTRTFSDFAVLTCFMFPFYIDELVTMTERMIDKQPLTRPHRRHFYQVLANEGGIAHWKVSMGYGIAQLIVGIGIWYLVSQNLILGVAGILGLIFFFFIVNKRVKLRLNPHDKD